MASLADDADLPVFWDTAGLTGPGLTGKGLMAGQPNIRFIIRPNSEERAGHGNYAPNSGRHCRFGIAREVAGELWPLAESKGRRRLVHEEECHDHARSDQVQQHYQGSDAVYCLHAFIRARSLLVRTWVAITEQTQFQCSIRWIRIPNEKRRASRTECRGTGRS